MHVSGAKFEEYCRHQNLVVFVFFSFVLGVSFV